MNRLDHPTSKLLNVTLLMLAAALAGCGGGGGAGGGGAGESASPIAAAAGPTHLEVHVTDVTGMAIEGAVVTVTVGREEQQATSVADGLAEFADLPSGETTIGVSAAGFETATFESLAFPGGPQGWEVTLVAEGAWAIGQAVVLGTKLVERASDGSSMTFSVDVAVIDGNLEALQTLTSADFAVVTIDCGWGGPRDCASDGEGNDTGSFSPDGGAQTFELKPAAARHPYLAGVLVERSSDVCGSWEQRAASLKSFFSLLAGNDSASLMTIQTENGAPTHTVLGPFTNDGTAYLEAVDGLTCPEAAPPAALDGLREAIRLAAAADGFGLPDVERHVVVLAAAGLTVSEVDAVAKLARESGVHISSIPLPWNWYGLPEAAARTGGFVSHIHDLRQLGMVFGAMDQLLAGAVPYYRMQFRLTGGEGTFVQGGNAKVYLRIDPPTPIPNRGVTAVLDVAIP